MSRLATALSLACVEALADMQLRCFVLRLGLPDAFVEHGEPGQLLSLHGLDATGIEAAVNRFVARLGWGAASIVAPDANSVPPHRDGTPDADRRALELGQAVALQQRGDDGRQRWKNA